MSFFDSVKDIGKDSLKFATLGSVDLDRRAQRVAEREQDRKLEQAIIKREAIRPDLIDSTTPAPEPEFPGIQGLPTPTAQDPSFTPRKRIPSLLS